MVDVEGDTFSKYLWANPIFIHTGPHFKIINKASGCCMYHQFNTQQIYVLPTRCINVFCVDLRTNSDYFPIQHKLTGFFIKETESVYCAVRAQSFI